MNWVIAYTRLLSRPELIAAAVCGLGAHGYLAFGQDSSQDNPLVTGVVLVLMAAPAWYLFARLRQVLFPPHEYWVLETWDGTVRRYLLRAVIFLAKGGACVVASPVAMVACLLLTLLPTRLLGDASDNA